MMARIGIVERVDSDSAPCKECGQYLPSLADLLIHRREEHGEGYVIEFPYDGPIDRPRLRCPVCREVYFRIGVRVWRGKRLKVCVRKCARKVRAEVRAAVRKSPDDDQELVRRRIAWHYIREGRQQE
jgi:hypothetical protein